MVGSRPLRLIVLHRGSLPSPVSNPWPGPPKSGVLALARAIATSPGWRVHGPATLVARCDPEPVIAVIGRFDDAAEGWLAGATQQLASTLPHVVLMDQPAAEEACRRLAHLLVDTHGAASLQECRFTAVPRGGLIVLGLLAYLLGIPGERLLPPADPSPVLADADAPPLVVVDDVAISGLRLARFVASRPEPRLLIATLHSPPALRAAFVDRHPTVGSFVSAHDLRDLAPETMGIDYAAWVARWQSRVQPGTQWIGQPEHVVYPWNEPDLGVWNPVTEREEPGFHVVPPELCLKWASEKALDVQVMPTPVRALRPSPAALYGEHEGRVVIGSLDTHHAYELDGVGADMWRALLTTSDVSDAATQLASAWAVPLGQVRRDLETFAAALREAGLLVVEPA